MRSKKTKASVQITSIANNPFQDNVNNEWGKASSPLKNQGNYRLKFGARKKYRSKSDVENSPLKKSKQYISKRPLFSREFQAKRKNKKFNRGLELKNGSFTVHLLSE